MLGWNVVRDGRKIKRENRNESFKIWTIELYNLTYDVGEQSNLADKYPELVNKAQQIMNYESGDVSALLDSRNEMLVKIIVLIHFDSLIETLKTRFNFFNEKLIGI
ncbi:hypothetical protein [Aestuariibaculum suncheonense]|uniref:Uncharacterized protein n=1 Tax=Aestuariibaculum suncheonense TaxID=1028745 RepID=A0A8J6QFT6_9FLAO|nr:hypothetical protein [Aestuariibaculum suncheonense]MBD0834786.1 hypothetical protein [Aestuariibaculum suncheonense]